MSLPDPPTVSRGQWYLVLMVFIVTAAAGGAVFYLSAFTGVDPEWFKNVALTGFGALIGLLAPRQQ